MLRNIHRLVATSCRCEASRLFSKSSAHSSVDPNKEIPSTDEFEIVPLNSKYFESSWKLIKDVFFCEEKACQILKLDKNLEAQNELKELFLWMANDGLSFIIRDNRDDTVAAASLNKKWVPKDYKFLEGYHKKCKNAVAQRYIQEIIDLDIFKLCNANSIVELFMGASNGTIRGKRLTIQLYWRSIDIAKKLAKDPHEVDAPEVFLAVVTTPTSKQIVDKTKGIIKLEIRKEMEYEGQTGNIDYTVAYLPLV